MNCKKDDYLLKYAAKTGCLSEEKAKNYEMQRFLGFN